MLKDIATNMLSKDFLLNIDMLECIRKGNSEILFASNEAVLLIDIPSHIYMISTTNTKIAQNLIDTLPNNIDYIVAHENFSYDILKRKYNFNKTMICHNTVYTKKEPIKAKNSMIEIKLLTPKYRDFIIKNYSNSEIVEDEYIQNRIEANVMFGAFINNELCGFIGSHEEGSIGILEVIPKYRGQGIGTALQIAATNDALANKRYPYGQVVETNSVSIALQKKLGFELSKNKVYWLFN